MTKQLSQSQSSNLETAIMALDHALREQLIDLEFIKVNHLPVINGKEVTAIHGIPLRTHIYEHEADVWIGTNDTEDLV